VTQGEFLTRLGIETRAVSLMAKASHEVSEDISNALKRLVGGGRGGMGVMFKVLGVSDPRLTVLPGLSDEKTAGRSA
jgi:SAM-dependent MidA family methyltransferase